jgi:hypothetical protein
VKKNAAAPDGRPWRWTDTGAIEDRMLSEHDQDVRGALTRFIAEHGVAPDGPELAALLGTTGAAAEGALARLADAHALLLHPGGYRPWVVHPFALAPGSCWVETPRRGYWANCLYCGLGIAAALRCDAVITTRLGGEGDTAVYRVKDAALQAPDHVFHLSTPVARWWDNVIFACASFQPFRSPADAEAWCERHRLPLGAILSMPRLWAFAQEWYGGYLQVPWRKRSEAEIQALFARHGLSGPFWALDAP